MLSKANKAKEVKYWEKYWEGDILRGKRFLYDLVASFYRQYLIKPSLNCFVKTYFRKNSKILHAGCGGGEVDMDIRSFVKIIALDFSQNALNKYNSRYGKKKKIKIVLGDVRSLPFRGSSFDGIYNLGVMEHFNRKDITKILNEFYRVLKPKGIIIIFWPPEFGLSVIFFKILVFLTKSIFQIKKVAFHPLEISRLQSEGQANKLFAVSGFKVIRYYFGIRDLFTYSVIVAQK